MRRSVCSAQQLTPLVVATCCPPLVSQARRADVAWTHGRGPEVGLRWTTQLRVPVLAHGLVRTHSPCCGPSLELRRQLGTKPRAPNPEKDSSDARGSGHARPRDDGVAGGEKAGPSGGEPAEPAEGLDAWREISQGRLLLPSAAMVSVVIASNYLVQFPVNEWLTYGTLSYPLAFLITNVTNRTYGHSAAQAVVCVCSTYGHSAAQAVVCAGIAVGAPLSVFSSSPRIALASAVAFAASQLTDIKMFHRLRHRSWYIAPMVSNSLASVVDTTVFMSIAFAGTDVPYMNWVGGELAVKLGVALCTLLPFRYLTHR